MIIGITGKKGSGKSLAASIIQEARPGEYTLLAFADPLREVAKVIFGLTDEEMSDPGWKELPSKRYPYESPRSILQQLGTDCVRNQWPEAWTNAWARKERGNRNTVTPDVRFLNESYTIRSLGGYIIRVTRPGLKHDTHISETEMDKIHVDCEIVNDGDKEEFGIKILETLETLESIFKKRGK